MPLPIDPTPAHIRVVRPPVERPYTVVFDGDCRVCTRLTDVLRTWDRDERLEIVSSQTPGVMARFPWIPARAYVEALQLVAADGTTWEGAAAVEELLNVLPKGRFGAWLFKLPFARGVADRFYKWFARNRYKLGCGEHCQLRPPGLMQDEADRGSSG